MFASLPDYPQAKHLAAALWRGAGQARGAALNEHLRERITDNAWFPSPTHRRLLQLPWADVLTTNYDTLLERAATEIIAPAYDLVKTATDLVNARRPRIVKLHGSIGDDSQLVLTEDDYRIYPSQNAAMANLARQVFIENELCLLGFSGDDPYFLQWSGWVRDHLQGTRCTCSWGVQQRTLRCWVKVLTNMLYP